MKSVNNINIKRRSHGWLLLISLLLLQRSFRLLLINRFSIVLLSSLLLFLLFSIDLLNSLLVLLGDQVVHTEAVGRVAPIWVRLVLILIEACCAIPARVRLSKQVLVQSASGSS